MQNKTLQWAATVAVFLALFVVMLGAYTRLTDAGLGCPDWPGCYGRMVLPSDHVQVSEAQTKYPQIPIESRKAWTEMAHRYAAGSLALLIFFIGFRVLRSRRAGIEMPYHLPLVLCLFVFFQAALGMWTVTLKLLPVVVMAHLLGGMLIFAFLCRFRLQVSPIIGQDLPQWRPWLRLGVCIVFLQIALGGWVSANYAGVACVGFPRCNGLWIPDMHLSKGFNLLSSVGANYQGGLLDNPVRITIQFIHRLGALVTVVYILGLASLIFFRSKFRALRSSALILGYLVLAQFTLGLLNVIYFLPVHIAVAHNGVAALLLATIFSMLHFTRKGLVYAN